MKKKIILIGLLVIAILLGICFGIGLFNKNKSEENTIVESEYNNENTLINEIFNASDINEDLLEKEGFEEENPNFISSSIENEEKFVVGAKQSQPIYYSQIDSRWRNHPYTITGNSGQTIGTSGCGPTSAAMIVTTIKGTITPPDMGDLFIKHGFRTTNNGTYFSAFPWVADYFGIEMERVYSTYDMAAKVKDGYIAVVSCSKGLWTTGGHFITVMGNDNGTLKVFDPYLYNGKFDTVSRREANVRVEGNSAYVTVQNFKDYSNAKAFWCYKYKDVSETKIETKTEEKTETKTETYKSWTGVVIAKSGLNIRKGPSTNYKKVGLYRHNTKITIIGKTGNWYKTNKGYVSAQYVSKSKENSSSSNKVTSKYVLGRYRVKVSSVLNVRSGPGTEYRVKKTYKNGTVFDTYEIKGDWARTPSGWVNLKYTTLIYKY